MVLRGLVYKGLMIKGGGCWEQRPLSLVPDSTQPGLAVFLQAGHQSMKGKVWPTEGLLDRTLGWKRPLRR